ncbi:MAG: GGDEF domain-containing protein [Gemmatimonadota bacterium]|nr:GGDEF domain-containing protein [Gemmatimonadota bacterium]
MDPLALGEGSLSDLVIETAREGVWTVDREGRTTFASRRLAEILGCPAEELAGRPLSDFLAPAGLDWLGSLLEPSETDEPDGPGAPEGEEEATVPEVELSLDRTDGRTVSTLVRSRALREPEGRVKGHLLLVTDLSDLKSYERELELLTMYDALTRLPNRTLFEDRLGHALKRRARFSLPVACIVLDIDSFSVINATQGPAASDELLRLVSKRLLDRVRPEDTVARLRADQFGVLLESVPGLEAAVAVVRRLEEGFEQPFTIGGRPVRVTASIGLALNGADDQSAEELFQFALVAMRRAKQKHELSTSHALFDVRQDLSPVRRRHQDEELREAIARGDLRLHFQPLVRLADRAIVGAEALVRWTHPTKGFIYPAEFIELANVTGLIVDVGRWVTDEAFEHLARWTRQPGFPDDFRLGLNVSERQLHEPSFVEDIAARLEAFDLPPAAIQLEVREAAAIRLQHRLAELRRMGIQVAVDDVGKGQASLERLARLEADTIKVDRSFIAGLGSNARDRAIVESFIVFADLLGIGLVAEGVENETQLKLLEAMGCATAQGFYFARPTVPDLFEKALAGQAGRAVARGA